jgi:phage replication O-like protein O
MADVQIDNGEFTRIANVLLEQSAKIHLNGTQYSIILTVWRFTYGFQRCEHELSITFIARATGISTRAIKKELKTLIDRSIILVSRESTKADSRVIKFNKNYDTWEQGNNSSPGEQLIPSQGNNSSPQQGNKTTPKKESKENSKESEEFFNKIWSIYPSKLGKSKVSKTRKDILFKLGEDQMTKCIESYIKSVEERRKKGFKELQYQNGSTFFNKGYEDFIAQEQDKPLRPPLKIVVVDRD